MYKTVTWEDDEHLSSMFVSHSHIKANLLIGLCNFYLIKASKNRTGQKRKISSSAHAKKTVATSTAGPYPKVPASSSSHRTAESPRFSRPQCLVGNYGGAKHASDAPSVRDPCL